MKKNKNVKFIMLLCAFVLCFAALFAFSSCGEENDGHVHDYKDWELSKAPTCTENGSERAVCTICGKEGTRSVEKLGHDYSGEPIVVEPATCQKEGEVRYVCKNGCGIDKTEPTARTQHDFSGEEKLTPATCTQNGERRVKCLHCDEEKVTVLSRLGHQYDEEGSVTKPATCEEDGERVFTCERCKETVTETIEALGHEYGDFIVDKPSTFTEDGQKSRHCIHKGCISTKDVTRLPAGENVEYCIIPVRSGGIDYPFPSELSVVLYDENGEKADVGPYKLKDGAATFTVKDRPYRVKIEGLREGYAQSREVVLSRNEVDVKVEIGASLVLGEEKQPKTPLFTGDPMHDFLVYDVHRDGGAVKFSDLLKGKKGAYLYFFYVGCGACSSQFPVFVEAYNAYGEKKNDLLVIMINVYSEDMSGQSRADMKKYAEKYPEEILMTTGRRDGIYLFDWVEHSYNAVPFSYFIDGEGVIDEIVYANSRAELEKQYDRVLTRLLGERPAGESGAKQAALLPQNGRKQRFV